MFKKKRKILMVNDVLTVIFTNGTSLVINNATRDDFEWYNSFIDEKGISDKDLIDHYYIILEQQKKEQEDKPKTETEKTIAHIIEVKEEKKKVLEEKKEEAKKEIIIAKEFSSKFPILIETGDFVENDGILYMKTSKGEVIPLSIPKVLVTKFIKLVTSINNGNSDALDKYVAYKNFWMWCSLCPNPQSREDLFGWIDRNDLQINKNGFFFAYRKVVSVKPGSTKQDWEYDSDDDDEDYDDENDMEDEIVPEVITFDKILSEFISNSKLKIKGQKKSSKNFSVYFNSEEDPREYKLVQNDRIAKDAFQSESNIIVGNLEDLYQTLTNSGTPAVVETSSKEVKKEVIQVQTYTDAHTHSMDIRIGHEVSLPADKCDWDNLQSCSNGLHIRGSKDHGCGDTTIVVLINPMNVVAVPLYDNTKMRVRAYYPVAVVNHNEDGKILNSIDTLELADEYLADQVKNLNNMLKNSTPKELIAHKMIADLPKETLNLLKEAIDIKEVIRKRVINK